MTDTLKDRSTHEPEAATSGLRRVAALSASLVGTYAVTSVLGLLFWLLAARAFPLASVGVGGAGVALMMLLGTLGTFGLGTLLIARLPLTDQAARRVLVRTALSVAGVAGALLATVVPFVAIVAFGVDDLRALAGTPWAALLLAAGTGLMAVSIVADQAVLTLGNGTLQLERNTVASAVKLVALGALALAGVQDGLAIVAAWSLGTLLSLPLVAWRTRGGRGLAAPGPLLHLPSLRGLGKEAASHHALNTTLQAPLQLLPLLVLVAISSEANGVFNTALQVTGAVFALPFAISVALFASTVGSERDLRDKMRLTVPLAAGISLLANLALFPLAGVVLSVFGADYSAQGVEVLRLLALAGLPFVIKDHYVALRRVQGRTTEATVVLVSMAVVELVFALIGVAHAGLVGLCIGWLVALVLEAVVLGVALLRPVRPVRPVRPARGRPGRTGDLFTGPATTAARTPRPATLPVVEDSQPVDDRLPAHLGDQGGSQPEPHGPLRRLGRLLGVGPALLLMTAGLLPLAQAVAMAREEGSSSTSQALYVLALVLIFAPAAIGVLLPGALASTRMVMAVAMAVLLQLTRLVVDPTRFMLHDELIHANALRLIEQSGRLYSDNPLLPVTAFYPGLHIAADAVRDLTGLGDHTSAIVVLLAARLVLALSVLAVVTLVTRSPRIGATAVVVYACNPQMLVFNAQFSYQTLALPLAALTIYLVLSRRRDSRWGLVPAVLAGWAVAASHHLTAVLLIAALGAWLVLELMIRRGQTRSARALAAATMTATVGLVATLLVPANPLLGYLGEIFESSYLSLTRTLAGQQSREVFQNSAGVRTAAWEKYAILASLVLTLLVLVVALWRARRLLAARRSFVLLLVLIAMIYPVIPGGHVTTSTAEVGDRSAGFVFLGVAFVVAWWVWQRPMRLLRAWVLGIGATVVFIGSVVLGAGSISNQLPGPFRVSDDARSIDADNLAAAAWMQQHLPTDSVVYGDRVGGLLAAAYGHQYVVTHIGTDIDASRLLLDPDLTRSDVDLVRKADIRYLIADRRNANGLPNQGVYIENGEFGGPNRAEPVPAAALRKFSQVPGVDAIYDNGSIVIYDLEALDG